MNNRDMSYFMDADLNKEFEEVEIEGIDLFRDKEGNNIKWVVKPIEMKDIERIREKNTTKKKKGKGYIKELNEKRFSNEIILESIIFPDFKDKGWLDKEKLLDPIELMEKVLRKPTHYTEISNSILVMNGLKEKDEEDIEEDDVKAAKN